MEAWTEALERDRNRNREQLASNVYRSMLFLVQLVCELLACCRIVQLRLCAPSFAAEEAEEERVASDAEKLERQREPKGHPAGRIRRVGWIEWTAWMDAGGQHE